MLTRRSLAHSPKILASNGHRIFSSALVPLIPGTSEVAALVREKNEKRRSKTLAHGFGGQSGRHLAKILNRSLARRVLRNAADQFFQHRCGRTLKRAAAYCLSPRAAGARESWRWPSCIGRARRRSDLRSSSGSGCPSAARRIRIRGSRARRPGLSRWP